jgi:F-type H+-transporting ATPase subunit b
MSERMAENGSRSERLTRTLVVLSLALVAVAAFGGVALASGGEGGHGFSLKEHGYHIINFVLFVALLVFFLARPLARFLAERSDQFARRLAEAQEQEAKAATRLQDMKGKVETMELEAAALLQRLSREGAQQAQAIAERAAEEARKIQASALTALENEKRRAEKKFQRDVGLAALAAAEERLKAGWRTFRHERYLAAFVEGVGQTGPAGAEGPK